MAMRTRESCCVERDKRSKCQDEESQKKDGEKDREVLPQGPLGAWPPIDSPSIHVLGGNKLALRVFYFYVTKNILLIQNIQ